MKWKTQFWIDPAEYNGKPVQSRHYELSIVTEDHESRSYGWPGPRKLIIFSTGCGGGSAGNPGLPFDQRMERACKLLQDICDAMNAAGVEPMVQELFDKAQAVDDSPAP